MQSIPKLLSFWGLLNTYSTTDKRQYLQDSQRMIHKNPATRFKHPPDPIDYTNQNFLYSNQIRVLHVRAYMCTPYSYVPPDIFRIQSPSTCVPAYVCTLQLSTLVHNWKCLCYVWDNCPQCGIIVYYSHSVYSYYLNAIAFLKHRDAYWCMGGSKSA